MEGFVEDRLHNDLGQYLLLILIGEFHAAI